MPHRICSLIVLLLILSCAPEERGAPPIEISDLELRTNPLPGRPAALYLNIRNNQDRVDQLTSVDVSSSARAAIHETVRDGDVMRMREVSEIEIPAGDTVVFERGGRHIMVFDIATSEDPVRFTFFFDQAGEITAEVAAKGLGED